MKARTLIIIALILSLSVVQIQAAAQTVNIFNPYSTTAKKYRCMSKTASIKRVPDGKINATAYEHCKICRADKDNFGKNLSPSEASGENALGTFALRPYEKKFDAQITCQKTLNEDKVKADYDSENKIARCELYDHYGQCSRCMIGYGLQWDASAQNGEQLGAYKCIDNQYRTPYCHKYDSSNKCMECKWNQDPEMQKLYESNGTNKDQSYELDFALYEYKKITYCINNRQKDPQLAGIDDGMVETKLIDHCASYDSERKCQSCHSRKFNLEGMKQYDDSFSTIETNQHESYKKPIYDYMLNKFASAKPTCEAQPTWFRTKPQELDNWQNGTTERDESKCGENKVLKLGSDQYGCGTKLDNCDTYNLDWDTEYFQEQGVWVYKIVGCKACETTYALNTSTQTCQKAQNDLANCTSFNDSGCTVCTGTGNVVIRVTKDTKVLAKCGTVATITNCPNDQVYTNSKDKKRCTKCEPGYVIKRTDEDTDDTCVKIKMYMQNGANSDKYEEFKRGCTMIDGNNQCTEDKGGLGYSENSRCSKGLLDDNLLCKTTGTSIDGCSEYINVEGVSRCVKCADDRQINYSGTKCLANTENNTVKNCAIMEGVWCQRCLRNQGTNKNIHYELTQWNTCVQIKQDATDEDKQCVYRNYEIKNGETQISPTDTCLLCTDQYYVEGKVCTLLPQYVTDTNTVAILVVDSRLGDRTSTWAQGVKVENCKIHKDLTGKCFQCDRINGELYGVDGDEKCEKCANNQTVKKDNSGAIKCSAAVSQAADPVTDNCLIKNGDDCQVCEFGFERNIFPTTEDDDTCKNLVSYGCSKINETTSSQCDLCVEPFIEFSKKCHLRIQNCIDQSDATTCSLCEPGYEFHSGQCVLKTELCNTQDWGKSWDPITLQKRANVCKTCFNIGNKKDFIRLFKKGDTLYQGCLSGCEDQKLYRKMSTRSDANPFYEWSCSDCRNENYHYLNTETKKQCEPAGVITNCNTYVNNSSNGDSLCSICDNNYSVKEGGKSCETCSTVTNCIKYDNSKPKVDNKCQCIDCNKNISYLSGNECKSYTTITECISYSTDFATCTECNTNFFLKDNKCESNTATNCAKKSITANVCETCVSNHSKNDSGVCVELTSITNCKIYETNTLCQECDDGYGLNKDRTGCLNNSEANQKRSQKCFQYGTTDVDDTDRKNQYPVCIKCYEKFALDYDHNDLEKQCVSADYCERAIYSTGNHIDDDQKCQICKTTFINKEGETEFVYKTTNDDSGVCKVAGTSTKEVENCRIYNNLSESKCYDCHDAFSPDSDNGEASICISDDHPGALPGCKFYDNVNQQYGQADKTRWTKYEWLKCKTCEHEWRYHSAPADTTLSKYNYNTYTRDCDIVSVKAITLPAVNTWSGKDGGLRSGGGDPGTGDDDGSKPLPSDDREQYEDPIVFANILTYSVVLLLIVMSVL